MNIEKIKTASESIFKQIKRAPISHIGGELRNILYFAGEGASLHFENNSFYITLKNGHTITGLHLYHKESDTLLNIMN